MSRPRLITSVIFTLSFAVPAANGQKVYWTDPDARVIRRANLDGTVIEDLVTTGLIAPIGIVVAPSANKMVWTDFLAARIQRASVVFQN